MIGKQLLVQEGEGWTVGMERAGLKMVQGPEMGSKKSCVCKHKPERPTKTAVGIMAKSNGRMTIRASVDGSM
jgi:hypothetical protein